MVNNNLSKQRIEINEKIKNINRVVKQIGHCLVESVELDSSIKNREQFAFLETQRLLSVCEYCPYQQISFKTFAGENNNDLSYLSKAQLGVALKLFMNIVITINQLHRKHIYHFDIKPENILASETDFCIIDFGSAMHVEEKATHPLIEGQNIAQVYQGTELFSSSKLDSKDFWVVCDKYDSYSMGCVLYFILTSRYISKPMEQTTEQFAEIVDLYGYLVADLISGLTRGSIPMRYSLDQILKHPALIFQPAIGNPKNILMDMRHLVVMNRNQLQFSQQTVMSSDGSSEFAPRTPVYPREKKDSAQLLKYLFETNSIIRTDIYSKTNTRSLSGRKIKHSKRAENLWDDQYNIQYQNALRHNCLNINVCSSFTKRKIYNLDIYNINNTKTSPNYLDQKNKAFVQMLDYANNIQILQQEQLYGYKLVFKNSLSPKCIEANTQYISRVQSAESSQFNLSENQSEVMNKVYQTVRAIKPELVKLELDLDVVMQLANNSLINSIDDFSM
ncbi:Kinase [Hexamita inflata]|uniref:CAMK CAMKL n=1 Tax=Hexamita inflata TaxID=28002 RepID=A0AA86NYF3_9EUKA|nr:CAMK CAMKL [Hexamita inflata]